MIGGILFRSLLCVYIKFYFYYEVRLVTVDIIKERLQFYKDDIKRDLSQLIAINSERDLTTKQDNAPFGIGIRKCFDKMIEFAEREGFIVEDFNGYAMHIEYGEGSEILGILGHLDIVEVGDIEKWNHNPFDLVEINGFWYGRGVNDNKGPMIGCLYLLKVLKELNYHPRKRIRLIIGGAEETTWECMTYYFNHNEMPIYGFSPDGDFPIINCEKGIGYYCYNSKERSANDGLFNIVSIKSSKDITKVCDYLIVNVQTQFPEKLACLCFSSNTKIDYDNNMVIFIYEGISARGRNPNKGENAIFKFVKDFKIIEKLDTRSKKLIKFLDKYFVDSLYGEKLGLFYEDEETGCTTSNLSYLLLEEDNYVISFDYRYPKGVDHDKIVNILKEIGNENKLELVVIKEMPLLYVSPDSQLIIALKTAYKAVTGDIPQLFSKGAASYARALKQAVAFGPTFPLDTTNSHRPNECINIENLMKALLIYSEVIKLLT
nr:Sapep family Mn(2+)-dependent dipeptidase [Tissierella simiarum]